MENEVKDRIPPEKAMEILTTGGMEVNIEQTKMILEFLYTMVDIAIEQSFEFCP